MNLVCVSVILKDKISEVMLRENLLSQIIFCIITFFNLYSRVTITYTRLNLLNDIVAHVKERTRIDRVCIMDIHCDIMYKVGKPIY